MPALPPVTSTFAFFKSIGVLVVLLVQTFAYVIDKKRYVVFRRIEGCHQPVLIGWIIPDLEKDFLLQSRNLLPRKIYEYLVRLDLLRESNPFDARELASEQRCQLVRMTRAAQPEIVPQQSIELRCHESHLRGELHRLHSPKPKVLRQFSIEIGDGFRGDGAVLCSAK